MNLQITGFEVPTKVCQNSKQQNQPLQCTSKIYSCEKSVQKVLQIGIFSKHLPRKNEKEKSYITLFS